MARSKAYPCTSFASRRSQGPSKRNSTPSRRTAAISACMCILPRLLLEFSPHAEANATNRVALHELMLRFSLPFCSALPRPSPPASSTSSEPTPAQPQPPPPITASTSIIDLGGVSLSLMWSLRRHLQQASELATAHYPETIHQIAVVNAPAFFPTIWSWIKVRRPVFFG